MFGKSKKEKEKVTVVTTEEQLEAAVKRKDTCIEVKGELADKMKWMAKLSPEKIAAVIECLEAALVASVLAMPGMPPVASPRVGMPPVFVAKSKELLTAAGVEALDVASIIEIAFWGVGIVIEILEGYNVELKEGDRSLRLIANK